MESHWFKEFVKENYSKNLDNTRLSSIKTDSRKIENGDIFAAIKGEKNNANDYIEDVLSKGASVIISDDKLSLEKYKEKVILVKDTITFLQEFGNYYRRKLGPTVVGITGSNGKTTTKDMLHSILNQKGKSKKTIGNLNNHIGVPLTLFQLEKDDIYSVVEMGMSDFGEIERLCQIAEPDYGIITNIGDSHMEFMKTRENVFKAKTEMIKYLKNKPVVNGDDEFLAKIDGIKAGFGSGNDIRGENLVFTESGTEFDLIIKGSRYRAAITLAGEHNVLDALLAAGAASEMGIEPEIILAGLKEAQFTKMRFEKIEKNGKIYINDAYNASPVSMKYSLETFSKIYNENQNIKIAVLGDMLELGEKSKEYHEELAAVISDSKIDTVYLYGKEMKYLSDKLSGIKETVHFNTKEEIKEAIDKIAGKKVILLKGSRGMKMEDIID